MSLCLSSFNKCPLPREALGRKVKKRDKDTPKIRYQNSIIQSYRDEI